VHATLPAATIASSRMHRLVLWYFLTCTLVSKHADITRADFSFSTHFLRQPDVSFYSHTPRADTFISEFAGLSYYYRLALICQPYAFDGLLSNRHRSIMPVTTLFSPRALQILYFFAPAIFAFGARLPTATATINRR
jgi:hypothetical protein